MVPPLDKNDLPKEEPTAVDPNSVDDISLHVTNSYVPTLKFAPLSPNKSFVDKLRDIRTIQQMIKFFFFVMFIIGLLFARMGVPDNEVECVKDKVIESLLFANRFINTPGNEVYRDLFQTICSICVDVAFFTTFGYWVLHCNTLRFPITLGVFYGIRALVQAVWFSPFPEGFYWSSPGFPSLVVPYGRGSDFFFSGHAGFMMICTMEWHAIGVKKMRNFMIGATLYTFLILLVYRIHYSIDVFTGAIFAEWCFGKVDIYGKKIDRIWMLILDEIMIRIETKDSNNIIHKESVIIEQT